MRTSFSPPQKSEKRERLVTKKSLLNPENLEEIIQRIYSINEYSERKWGEMNAGQMLRHCDNILKVGIGKIILPKTNFFIKTIGIFTKYEMQIFNNGIPKNMPTFANVKVAENCNLEKSRTELLITIKEFVAKAEKNNLISQHELFGKMTTKNWGFMEYKHLDHHLKQFGI